jgi:hypothetical protein
LERLFPPVRAGNISPGTLSATESLTTFTNQKLEAKMEEEFNIKGRVRNLAIVAGGVLLLVVIAVILLTSGGTKDSKGKSFPKNASRWEYTTTVARCNFDKSTNKMICQMLDTKDQTEMSGMLANMGNDGWELMDMSSSSDKSGPMQAFTFKRPK